MTQVRITDISGSTAYPFSVYIADVYGNNQTLLGTISTGVPPIVEYNTVIPAIFQTAPEIMLKLVDSNNCEVFKILQCTFGCTFDITIELASCIVNMSIQEANCNFSIYSTEENCSINII
jgi:hypothetical protein